MCSSQASTAMNGFWSGAVAGGRGDEAGYKAGMSTFIRNTNPASGPALDAWNNPPAAAPIGAAATPAPAAPAQSNAPNPTKSWLRLPAAYAGGQQAGGKVLLGG